MTERMKQFLEFVSKQDPEIRQKTAAMGKDALIAYAAENGYTLLDEDFVKPDEDEEGEVSLQEADAISGSDQCFCAIGGGGKEGYWTDDSFGTPQIAEDNICACVFYGEGFGSYEFTNKVEGQRCECIGTGSGYSRKQSMWHG